MSEADPLADRLAALRTATIAATRPPGIEAVRRTVARRDAVRTVAGGAVAALLAVAFVLAGATGRAPDPVVPPTIAPSTSLAPSTVESASSSPTAGASTTATAASGSSEEYGYPCGYVANTPLQIIFDDASIGVSPPDYWSRCPDSRLRVISVTYEWDVNSQQYALAHLTTVYLTAANRNPPKPKAELDPIASVCGYAWALLGTDLTPPAALPAAVVDSASPYQYWEEHGYGAHPSQAWQTTPNYRQMSVCQPTPNGSP